MLIESQIIIISSFLKLISFFETWSSKVILHRWWIQMKQFKSFKSKCTISWLLPLIDWLDKIIKTFNSMKICCISLNHIGINYKKAFCSWSQDIFYEILKYYFFMRIEDMTRLTCNKIWQIFQQSSDDTKQLHSSNGYKFRS